MTTVLQTAEVQPFNAWMLIKATEETYDDFIVSGPIADVDGLDYDGELVTKAGVLSGIAMWAKLGSWVDWEHLYPKTRDPKWLIGKGMEVFDRDGRPWLKVRLDKASEIARTLIEKMKSVKDAHFGFSIYGKCAKDPNNDRRIIGTEIHYVTISPTPKGFGQNLMLGSPGGSPYAIAKAIMGDEAILAVGRSEGWLEPIEEIEDLTKALTTGNAIVAPGSTGGQALRTQNLTGSIAATSYDDPTKPRRPRRKKKKRMPESSLVKALVLAGARHPEAVARFISRGGSQ